MDSSGLLSIACSSRRRTRFARSRRSRSVLWSSCSNKIRGRRTL